MRISDWSSDVCSSDLIIGGRIGVPRVQRGRADIVADQRRILVEQILDRQREREDLGDLGPVRQVEIAVARDMQIIGLDPVGVQYPFIIGAVETAPQQRNVAASVDLRRRSAARRVGKESVSPWIAREWA